MRISILSIGAIASVLSINSFAETTTSTITTQDYVDAMDEELYNALNFIKQNKIPATGTNASTPGTTVVTYTNTAGTIGERGIYDGSTTYDSSTDADKLVTASALQNATNLPEKTVTHRTCTRWIDGQSHTDANCLLWNLVDETVYGGQCNTDVDCAGYVGTCTCINHLCNCNQK